MMSHKFMLCSNSLSERILKHFILLFLSRFISFTLIYMYCVYNRLILLVPLFVSYYTCRSTYHMPLCYYVVKQVFLFVFCFFDDIIYIFDDIIFNPIKSQYMVFKPNRFKLYFPAVYLNGNIIDYVEKTKYLGYMFTNDKQDDVEMLRQLRLLYMYMQSNKIISMFYFCTIDVKLELFRSFCMSFYCCYLWTGYEKSTFHRLRVAFNNAYRRILDLPWRCSASGMYATYGIYNLEAIIRNQTFGFIGRLRKSCNTIVQTLKNAWIIRIQLWHTWFEVLYTNI